MLAELHCHLDGLVDAAMLRELARDGDELPVSADEVAAVTPVRSLDEWMQRYQPLVAPCMRPTARLLPIVAVHVRRLVAQSVDYAELMVSDLLFRGGEGTSVVERFQSVRDAVDAAAAGAIHIELLAAIGRGPLARVEAQAERILAVARAGLITGVAIAGNENACSIRSIAGVLDSFRDAGLGIEIHAGEQAGPESVWDALEHGRPDRIGHGVRAFEDERLVAVLCERDVHLEFCPTSNLYLGVVADIAAHPLGRARALGMSYGINTDDPGPFGCSLSSEHELVARVFDLGDDDRATIDANTRRARFTR